MKKITGKFFKSVFPIVCVCAIGVALLIFPKTVASGVRDGLYLLGNNLIPSLFPFTVLSSYISNNGTFRGIAELLEKPSQKIFKINGNCLTVFILGILGGYPVGAKAAAEFYTHGQITQNEAERLLYWCINPSPSFTITALGAFMLGSLQSGVIVYCACILASLTVGFLCRFLCNGETPPKVKPSVKKSGNALADCVADGTSAMLAISGWILVFSAANALCRDANLNETLKIFLSCTAEVTAGCQTAVSNGFPLNAIAAVAGFGGFAVICQTAVYAETCSVKLRNLICAKVVSGVFSGVYASVLSEIFPEAVKSSVDFAVGNRVITLYHSIPAAAILMIMCAAFILEVDNHRKVC